MKASLGALIVNVAVIHGAGLVLLNQQTAAPTTALSSAQAAQVLHVRLAEAPQARPRTAEATPAAMPQAETATTADVQQTAAQTEPALTESAAAPPAPQTTPESPQTDAPLQATTEEYVPRPRLSVSPSAATPVIVPFPSQFDGSGRYTSVLALYIDEDGIVRRVRFDDATLPQSMKDAARQAFLQAHFQPGQVKGQVVKSLIHVQVVFDNTPITPDTSYTTL